MSGCTQVGEEKLIYLGENGVEVFGEPHDDLRSNTWVLVDYNMISSKTVGVDATAREGNAAMHSIVRKNTKRTTWW